MLKVTCAIIIENNKILITRRGSGDVQALKWEFPGGKIEPSESKTECIIREIDEELSLEIQIIEELQSVQFHYPDNSIELIPFLCQIIKGNIQLNEHIDFRWIKLNETNSFDLSDADRKLIQNPVNFRKLKKYIGE